MRLMIYDRTCTGRYGVGLSHSWIAGGRLYRSLGRIDAWYGASSWEDALHWLNTVRPGEQVSEVQFWGHGRWGQQLINGEVLDRVALAPHSRHRASLEGIRDRLIGADALWWFRTCQSFSCTAGFDFAQAWAGFFECDAAGHTFVIGPFQSGLHRLSPGARPHWPIAEGLGLGTVQAPKRALWSGPRRPNTITCFGGSVPEGW